MTNPRRTTAVALLGASACVLGFATAARNTTYESAEALWRDALETLPHNAHAHYNLGCSLSQQGRASEAAAEYARALAIQPDYSDAHYSLGNILLGQGRLPEAEAHYREALRLHMLHLNDAMAHNNLGNLLARSPGREQEAEAQFRRALAIRADYAEAQCNLAVLIARDPNRLSESALLLRSAIGLDPGLHAAHNDLGNVLAAMGRAPEAASEYRAAIALRPDEPQYHFNLALALLRQDGGLEQGLAELRQVLRLDPRNAAAMEILARFSATP